MNNGFIEALKKDKNYSKEEKDIIKCIMEAEREIETARMWFEVANEPELIDYAIYSEQAAKSKYMYFLNKAKSKNIKINYNYILKGNNVV
ncbi:DUF2508 family protein [Clostridium cochlearium]|uniref:DUF2508 family protein n=1 Tax=Clostridium cochlearium TaxID=1494 RepID=UPI001EDE5B1B|nr:DUF2508 family protein [Clostridium cochlearium]MCG4580257.1 YaaL family protein [Clostridium cochlearium]